MKLSIININNIKEEDELYIKENYPNRFFEAKKYSNHLDYLRSIGAFLLLDKSFSKFNETDFKRNEFGKPFIKGQREFNYSHSGNYVALVIDQNPVGIDVQEIRNNYDKAFLDQWSKKEALLKLLGTGIGSLKELQEISIKDEKIHYKNQLFYFFTQWIDEKTVLSICSKKKVSLD